MPKCPSADSQLTTIACNGYCASGQSALRLAARFRRHHRTAPGYNLPVYPNLAREIKPTARSTNSGAPITYTRLRAEFVYLAVVLDAFAGDRLGVGTNVEASLAIALRMALTERNPPSGLVHHSDRGVQYASLDYTEMLQRNQATISMSRKGNPYDNAACESFMKILKQEEVYRNEYRDFQGARASIGEFLERVYNQKRVSFGSRVCPASQMLSENGATPATTRAI